jgi:hypothetical protein
MDPHHRGLATEPRQVRGNWIHVVLDRMDQGDRIAMNQAAKSPDRSYIWKWISRAWKRQAQLKAGNVKLPLRPVGKFPRDWRDDHCAQSASMQMLNPAPRAYGRARSTRVVRQVQNV